MHFALCPYHKERLEALESTHRTLKATFTEVCIGGDSKQWDINLPYALFCILDTPHSSTGFFELVFGHHVCGPLSLIQQRLLDEGLMDVAIPELAWDMRHRLFKC